MAVRLVMGLMLKFRQTPETDWPIFFQHAQDLLQQGKLIGMPLGKAGYGFVADPANMISTDLFWQMYDDLLAQKVIFLVDSWDSAIQIGIFSDTAQKLAQSFWPGDLVLQVPFQNGHDQPIMKFVADTNPEILSFLQNRAIMITISSISVVQHFLQFRNEKDHLPLLWGNFAEIAPAFNVQDATTFVNEFSSDEVGVVFDVGRMQKGKKKTHPATIVSCLDADHLEIIQEGLISVAQIAECLDIDLEDMP